MTAVRTKATPVRYFWAKPIMKNILIATDFSPAARDATQYGIKLAEALEARVTLVTAFEEIPIPVGEAMNIITNDDSAATTLAKKTPQPRTLPERWFLRSNTKEMIFETSIPLLILPPQVRPHPSTL
jgi:hypothetical protein